MDRLKSKGMDQLNKRVWIDSRRHTVHTVFLNPFFKGQKHLFNGQNGLLNIMALCTVSI